MDQPSADLFASVITPSPPIYSVGGDGVITEANKSADGGSPSTSSFALTFDSGTVA